MAYMWRGEFKIKLLNSSFLSSQKNISSFPNEMKHFIRISYFLQSHISTLSSFSLFLYHALGPLNKGGLHVKREFKIKWLNSSFPSSQKKISSFPNEMKHFIRVSYSLQSHVSMLFSLKNKNKSHIRPT